MTCQGHSLLRDGAKTCLGSGILGRKEERQQLLAPQLVSIGAGTWVWAGLSSKPVLRASMGLDVFAAHGGV